MNRFVVLLAVVLSAAPVAVSAAPPGQNPEWPCQQPLVPVITAGMLWSGPSVEEAGDWHQESKVAALVERIAPRSVPKETGEAAIAEFEKGLGADRNRLITLAFAGLLAESNRLRTEIIGKIKDLAERQRNVADLVDRTRDELDKIPENAQGEEAAKREDLSERLTFTTRTYKEVQKTMRYACEVPAQLDARLGAYARALQAGLSGGAP
jgi:hypothetical protein